MLHIEDEAYRGSSVTEVELFGVRSIGASAFRDCPDLSHVEFSSDLRVIAEDAFRDCPHLTVTGVTIPDGCVTIGEQAFAGTGLDVLNLPDTIRVIGNNAFSDCVGLYGVTLPKTDFSLGAGAFSGCASMERIDLPDLFAIRDGTFSGCDLKTVVVPDSVLYVGRDAFANNRRLKLVSLPAKELRMKGSAFFGCDALTHVILRHKGGDEHRVFEKLPTVKDILRKTRAADHLIRSSAAALFRLAFPVALMEDEKRRLELLLRNHVGYALEYLDEIVPYLSEKDANTAITYLEPFK